MRTPIDPTSVSPDQSALRPVGPESLSASSPTPMQLRALVETVNRGNERAAAQAMGVSIHTVDEHLHRLYVKLGVGTRLAAVKAAWPLVASELLPDHPMRGWDGRDRRLGMERRRAA